MANTFGSALRSFWHTMTSYDRHSSFDSPYRSGRHVPLHGHGVLTSVATASESRADITSPYHDEAGRFSTSGLDTAYGGPGSAHSPMPMSPVNGRPYSPGLRSLDAKRPDTTDGFETQSPAGEIPMQSFHDGLPPPPPVRHTWSRVDNWAEENYPELFDQLCEACTTNDINELEHQLDCSLPQDVRESLQVHDGQERGGMPTGIIFSGMLMDCEEIVQEWENWRKVNSEFLAEHNAPKPSVPTKALGGNNQASSSKSGPSSEPSSPVNPAWRQDLAARQDCVPPNSVRKAYAHPAWIPLVRDWGGNNLAVDLAPGPAGTWGQVILFGRDYDTKYVVAKSWASFLATFADDLNSGKWFVDEDTNELKLREFKATRVEPSYFDILRWRMDQKYGRRANKRKSAAPGSMGSPTSAGSPYASPTEANGEPRGRSMQRLNSNSPISSPIRPAYGKPSPLARVTEESAAPLSLAIPNGKAKEKLVEVDTPRPSGEENVKPTKLDVLTSDDSPVPRENANTPTESAKVNGKQAIALDDAMKTIEI
ncbi:1,3-beta-glucan biosynthesis protein-like protein [Thozetella sp. PMI_491]|nr:1,3-beta-glucan biosynthesis protein-like protein [Thozetella sp. PMI_491]